MVSIRWISSHSFSPPFLTTTVFSYISLSLFFFLPVRCWKCPEKRWVRHEKGSRFWGVPWWVPGLSSDRPVPRVLQSLCGSQPCHQFGLYDWQHRHPRLVSLGHHLFTHFITVSVMQSCSAFVVLPFVQLHLNLDTCMPDKVRVSSSWSGKVQIKTANNHCRD